MALVPSNEYNKGAFLWLKRTEVLNVMNEKPLIGYSDYKYGVVVLLRCITASKETMISTKCDAEVVAKLVKKHQLFCPNCGGDVIFKKGAVNTPHFAHRMAECEYVGHEPETKSHIKGKAILYEWLKGMFPTAFVQYEVHIPATGQIADIYVEHRDGVFAGLKWAFEFQHSPITITQWEERHKLYESVDIQDFWIFDKAKFMKFSSARDFTDARKRTKFDEHIYDKTGLVYFLDVEKSEFTFEFNYTKTSRTILVGRYDRTQYFTYHNPRENTVPLSNVSVRKCKTFDYSVLVTDSLESYMEDRLRYVLHILTQKAKKKKEELYLERLVEKGKYARTTYGDKFTDRFKAIIEDYDGKLTYYQELYDPDDDFYDKELELMREDVIDLSIEEFFSKYKRIIEASIADREDYKVLNTSDDISLRVLADLYYAVDFSSVGFLKEQGDMNLQEYLSIKYKDKVSLVEYAYTQHRDTLDNLEKWNKDFVNERLSDINRRLCVYDSSPTAMDYAMKYRYLDSIDEVENCILQINEKFDIPHPLANG
ncbi:competence protein CoiA [Paenibacillus sp. OSY-SE]|uniref:competence protein CoiA n=1 Tax=Paenibacillus sp. OSY-SE TaxID=1196323 RepID=UPI0002DCB7A5|nr:competence protein CoiA family protein [Paenibacillus sp. OSY-SE]